MHLLTDEQRERLSKLPLKQRQKEILKEEYRNGEWYAKDIKEVTGDSIPKCDIWCFGAPCFVAGTLITTSEGLKPIEEISVGDKVLTHKNTFEIVTEKMINRKKGIYTLQVKGSPKTEVTGNHRFYVKCGDSTPIWKAIEDFQGDEYILKPSVDSPQWVRIEEISYEENREETVYNLEVENEHSYTANGLAAHNCQDFSIAGRRAGLDGDRSSLVREVFRILSEQEERDRPEWIVYENVKGMLSSNGGRDFTSILLQMEELRYDSEWLVS